MTKKTVQQLLKSDCDQFAQILDATNNAVDTYIEAEDAIKAETKCCRDEKKELDANIKKLATVGDAIRGHLMHYMVRRGISQLKGLKAKSVNYQPSKELIEVVSHHQIMVGNSYQNLEELSKADLVKMLEKKGVKTRIHSVENKIIKPATLRVIR